MRVCVPAALPVLLMISAVQYTERGGSGVFAYIALAQARQQFAASSFRVLRPWQPAEADA